MKNLLKLCLFSAMLALPSIATAQTATAPKDANSMNCPMAGKVGAMRTDMGAMIKDMNLMMASASDPAMKARMQKMHDQMNTMMTNMQNMGGGGMMGGGMMQGGQAPGGAR